MIRITDQMGNELVLNHPAQRIVSLVPSQTELLFDLGAGDQVAGLTKFCIHPKERVKEKIIVGGTKTLHLERIRALQPDLIIANKEENVKEQIETLREEFPVFTTDIVSLEDALKMIADIGKVCGKEREASELLKSIKTGITELEQDARQRPELSAIYLIWENPVMTVGGNNYIDSVMSKAGLQNLMSNRISGQEIQRYPEITIEEVKQLMPDLLLLSSEPFPFSERHIEKYAMLLPGIRIEQVDGEMFSWYGSSMLKAIPYLRSKLNSWHSN